MSTSFNTTNNLSGKSYQYNAGAWANNDNRYNTSYTYDANGNILTLSRHGGADEEGNVEEIDDLVYHYQNGNNQLVYVDDEQMNDLGLKDQSGGNYSYDEIGNLISDNSEGIQGIEWTVYGKVESVTKNLPTGGVGTTAYRYDAAGNRILKTVTTPEGKKETHYVRDASGNIMATYKNSYDVDGNPAVDEEDNIIAVQREFPIYGSSRIGTHQGIHEYYKRTLGYKRYELSNHLGNVLTTVTDKKIGIDENNDQVADYYLADIATISDYYPFGLAMKERSMSEDGYRFGFNGKENDRDFGNDQLIQDYGFRVYNPALGKFLSVDPISKDYPFFSPYQFAANRPIDGLDFEGLEWIKYRGWTQDYEKGGVLAIGVNVMANTVIGSVNGVAGLVMGVKDTGIYSYKVATGKANPVEDAVHLYNGVSSSISAYLDKPLEEQVSIAASTLTSPEAYGSVIGGLSLGGGKAVSSLANMGSISNRFGILKGTLLSYVNPVEGGSGLSFRAQMVRYVGTARFALTRPYSKFSNKFGEIRLRRYMDNDRLRQVMETGKIEPGRRGLVYNINAKGLVDELSPKNAERILGLAPGDGQSFLEFSINASRVRQYVHPWTNQVELNVKGIIDLKDAKPKFNFREE